jgi:hypothetical protein
MASVTTIRRPSVIAELDRHFRALTEDPRR